MFKWILDHLKLIAIIGLIVGAWIGFSVAINVLLPWDKLTDLFTVIRWFLGSMDWIIDTTAMLWAIGLTFVFAGLEWALFAGIMPLKWFKGKKE